MLTCRTRQVLDLRCIAGNPSLHFNDFSPPHPGFFSRVLAPRSAITILHSLPPPLEFSHFVLLAFLHPLSLSFLLFLPRSVAALSSDEKPV